MGNRIGIFLVLVVLIVGMVFSLRNRIPADEPVYVPDEMPTNFVSVGTVVYDREDLDASVPYLEHVSEEATFYTPLVLDLLSYCVAQNGSAPCVAMSISTPFKDARVIVEGITQDSGILVRKIRAIEEGEGEFLPEIGSVFISWSKAISLIENCEAKMVLQTHALDVFVTLSDGKKVRAVEPTIDEVFRIIENARVSCGNIPIATE